MQVRKGGVKGDGKRLCFGQGCTRQYANDVVLSGTLKTCMDFFLTNVILINKKEGISKSQMLGYKYN